MRFLWVLLLLAPNLARAGDAVRYMPARDVMIVYRATAGSNLPSKITLRYFAVADRIRLDGNQGPYIIIDRTVERIEMVLPPVQMAMEIPPGAGITEGFILGANLRFEPVGKADILGRPCTIYAVTNERARATACITADGLLLSGEGTDPTGHHIGIEATRIDFVAQPPGMFSPPDTYQYLPQPR
jgi:hypothetical protein